jgi:hypothetical protein
MIKEIFKLVLPQSALNLFNRLKSKKQFKAWENGNRPVPPPHIVKQITIKEYQQRYGITTLVETGTLLGDMVEAQKKIFKNVISIELGHDLFKKAKKRFKKDENVTIIHGDSGSVLPEILKNVNEPAIFWLDGHYSEGISVKGDKECPIIEELDAIFSSKKLNHIILIDDARCFIGMGDYPTIEKLTEYIKNKNERYQLEVKHDIIRYVI